MTWDPDSRYRYRYQYSTELRTPPLRERRGVYKERKQKQKRAMTNKKTKLLNQLTIRGRRPKPPVRNNQRGCQLSGRGGEGGVDDRGGGPNLPYPSSSYASSAQSITPTTTKKTAAISSRSDGVWDGVAHDVRGGRGAFRPIVETALATTGVGGRSRLVTKDLSQASSSSSVSPDRDRRCRQGHRSPHHHNDHTGTGIDSDIASGNNDNHNDGPRHLRYRICTILFLLKDSERENEDGIICRILSPKLEQALNFY